MSASFTRGWILHSVVFEPFFCWQMCGPKKPPTEPGKAPDPFRNLAAHIEAGILAPTELILAKDG